MLTLPFECHGKACWEKTEIPAQFHKILLGQNEKKQVHKTQQWNNSTT